MATVVGEVMNKQRALEIANVISFCAALLLATARAEAHAPVALPVFHSKAHAANLPPIHLRTVAPTTIHLQLIKSLSHLTTSHVLTSHIARTAVLDEKYFEQRSRQFDFFDPSVFRGAAGAAVHGAFNNYQRSAEQLDNFDRIHRGLDLSGSDLDAFLARRTALFLEHEFRTKALIQILAEINGAEQHTIIVAPLFP